jgi:hypothetical protein
VNENSLNLLLECPASKIEAHLLMLDTKGLLIAARTLKNRLANQDKDVADNLARVYNLTHHMIVAEESGMISADGITAHGRNRIAYLAMLYVRELRGRN